MGIFGDVLVFVKTAAGPAGTAVAGARGTVTPGTAEGAVVGAVRDALASKDAFAVVVAFQWHFTLMSEFPAELDFFADRGLVLSDGLGDCGFGRTVGNAGKDDASFLQGQMSKRIRVSHRLYQPFRQLSDRISVRLKATFVEEEMSERLKSTFRYSKWK